MCVGLVSFIAIRISPKFVVYYSDMQHVPLAEINKGFGFSVNPVRQDDAQTSLLRISVINNSSLEAENVSVVVDDYVRQLAFVLDENGKAIKDYSLSPSGGNSKSLKISIGTIPPFSEHVIFVGGRCLFIDFADVHADSSNLGESNSAEADELAGFRLFVGDNAEWIFSFFFVLLGIVLLRPSRKKE